MATLTADQFLERVLGDEGWQEGLDSDLITQVVQRLEELLPLGSSVNEAQADYLRTALRTMGEAVRQRDMVNEAAVVVNMMAAWKLP